MILFGNDYFAFEAVKCPEEDKILIAKGKNLYYSYSCKYKRWEKNKKAGNEQISVENYPEVSKEELMDAMDGMFPSRETDFMRKCHPSELWIRDMMDLLREDYDEIISECRIMDIVHKMLLDLDTCHMSYRAYEKIRELLESAVSEHLGKQEVLDRMVQLSFDITGRDIFKDEIRIVDGHDSSSYFWIMPVRVIDPTDTESIYNVAEMRSAEISIEEDDVFRYLTPFLNKYFDSELGPNKNRVEFRWEEEDGTEKVQYITGFEWNLTHNYFTYDSIEQILADIQETVNVLAKGEENEFTALIREKRGFESYGLEYDDGLIMRYPEEYKGHLKKKSKVEQVIDFYQRFIYRMEYMLKVGKEKGYSYISFMGP